VDEEPYAVMRESWVDLTVPAGDENRRDDLRTLLIGSAVPALVSSVDASGPRGVLRARLLASYSGDPLRVVNRVSAAIGWEPAPLADLVPSLARTFGAGVSVGGSVFDAADEEVPAELVTGETAQDVGADSVAWLTREPAWFIGLMARAARQPLVVSDLPSGRLVSASASPSLAVASGGWMVGDDLMLWRHGARRGCASTREGSALVHEWDDEWELVDPSNSGSRDDSQTSVREHLAEFMPPTEDANAWIPHFMLNFDQAQHLRVLFRHRRSDSTTFSLLATILDVPQVLADVAEGRTDALSVAGARIVHPATGRQCGSPPAKRHSSCPRGPFGGYVSPPDTRGRGSRLRPRR